MNVPKLRSRSVAAPMLALGSVALLGLTSGCAASNPQSNNHWNLQWVPRSIVYHTTGYQPDRDGTWREFQWKEKRAINLTLRRHFLNSNPYNPQQPEVKGYFDERPPHSILPDPIMYFHLSSVVYGAAASVVSTTHAFFPIPIDSILATLQPGGFEEFWEGINGPSEEPVSPYTSEVPPGVDEFSVHNANQPRFVGN